MPRVDEHLIDIAPQLVVFVCPTGALGRKVLVFRVHDDAKIIPPREEVGANHKSLALLDEILVVVAREDCSPRDPAKAKLDIALKQFRSGQPERDKAGSRLRERLIGVEARARQNRAGERERAGVVPIGAGLACGMKIARCDPRQCRPRERRIRLPRPDAPSRLRAAEALSRCSVEQLPGARQGGAQDTVLQRVLLQGLEARLGTISGGRVRGSARRSDRTPPARGSGRGDLPHG